MRDEQEAELAAEIAAVRAIADGLNPASEHDQPWHEKGMRWYDAGYWHMLRRIDGHKDLADVGIPYGGLSEMQSSSISLRTTEGIHSIYIGSVHGVLRAKRCAWNALCDNYQGGLYPNARVAEPPPLPQSVPNGWWNDYMCRKATPKIHEMWGVFCKEAGEPVYMDLFQKEGEKTAAVFSDGHVFFNDKLTRSKVHNMEAAKWHLYARIVLES